MASDYVNAHQVCGAADPQGNARRHDDQIILLQKPGIHARIYGTFEKLIRIGDFLDQQRSDPPAQAQLSNHTFDRGTGNDRTAGPEAGEHFRCKACLRDRHNGFGVQILRRSAAGV